MACDFGKQPRSCECYVGRGWPGQLRRRSTSVGRRPGIMEAGTFGRGAE